MRRLFNMPPQVLRIVLLAIGIVAFYLVARYFLKPQSFGEYGGWYRGAALAELADRPAVYAGKKACGDCHDEEYKQLMTHGHKSLSCEACHGPGQAHVDSPPDVKMDLSSYSHCIRCHEANPSRPKWHKQIVRTDHYSDAKCTDCHVPHMPSEAP